MAKRKSETRSEAQDIFRQMNEYSYADELFRKEYSDIRSLLNKRLQRAKQAGYLENFGYFPKLKDIPNRQALAMQLAQARAFYENPLSTSAGRKAQEQKTIKALQERGFEGVNRKNFKLFRKFMDKMKERYTMDTPDGKKSLYDSDKAVEVFEQISERFTGKTNTSAMMRYFNEWVSAGGAMS